MNDGREIFDVKYEDVDDEESFDESNSRLIKGSDNIRYSATQVAEMYNIPVSKVRYYMKCFEEILDLEFSNKMRRFTAASLKKFDYLIKLKDDGMTVQQILDYCENDDVFTEESLKTPDNPLTVEMLAKAISIQVEDLIKNFKSEIVSEVAYQMMQFNSILREDIVTTVDEVMTEKLQHIEEYSDEIKDKICEIEKKQDEVIKIASLDINQIKEQLESRKPWYKKIVNKFK